MALETLKGVNEIGGVPVYEVPVGASMKASENPFIVVNHNNNSLFFKLQNGPVSENGINGAQVDHVIKVARQIIFGLNQNFPSTYNTDALAGLDAATTALDARTADRTARTVEGTNQV